MIKWGLGQGDPLSTSFNIRLEKQSETVRRGTLVNKSHQRLEYTEQNLLLNRIIRSKRVKTGKDKAIYDIIKTNIETNIACW